MSRTLMVGVIAAGALAAGAAMAQTTSNPPDLRGDWSQQVVCRGHDTVDFKHQIRIYTDWRGLRFKGYAPTVSSWIPGYGDTAFYYGQVEVRGDIVTFKVSPRYYRYLPDSWTDPRYDQGVVVQDASYRLNERGELVALGRNACSTTPLTRRR